MEARRNAIFDIIEQKGEVSLKELEKLFPQYSSMTMRRDLDFLEGEGKIVKIKGGAKSIAHLSRGHFFSDIEDEYAKRELINPDKKQIIAKKAISILNPDTSFFLDAGSTMMAMAKNMSQDKFYIVTNGLNIAMEILKNRQAVVNLIGGEISRNNLCLSGPGAIDALNKLNFDMAFLGVSCFSKENGFTNADAEQCEIKKLAAKKAKKTVVLMDSSKIGRSMPYTFCMLSDIDILISELSPKKLREKIPDIPENVLVL